METQGVIKYNLSDTADVALTNVNERKELLFCDKQSFIMISLSPDLYVKLKSLIKGDF